MSKTQERTTVAPIPGRSHLTPMHGTVKMKDATTRTLRIAKASATESATQTRAKPGRRRVHAGTVINIYVLAPVRPNGEAGPDASSGAPSRRPSAVAINIASGAKVSLARPGRRSKASVTKSAPSEVAEPDKQIP